MGVGAMTLVILVAVPGVLVLARGNRSQPVAWRIAGALGWTALIAAAYAAALMGVSPVA